MFVPGKPLCVQTLAIYTSPSLLQGSEWSRSGQLEKHYGSFLPNQSRQNLANSEGISKLTSTLEQNI